MTDEQRDIQKTIEMLRFLTTDKQRDIQEAIEMLERNGSSIDTKMKVISSRLPGIGCLGAIDFLTKRGYKWTRK
jgi:hypothetical protein